MMKRLAFVKKFIERLTLLVVFSFGSCGYNDFDQVDYTESMPPKDSLQQISISKLKSLYVEGGVTLVIDAVIRGVVVANDIADNFYKKIVIQDSTGAIAVALGLYDLHNSYPLGSVVSVRVRGLKLGIDGGLCKLGMVAEDESSEISEIPTKEMIDKYLFGVTQDGTIVVQNRKISQLKESDIGKLVRVENLVADLSVWNRWAKTEKYSPTGYASSMDIAAVDESGATIYIYTSGYASFADELIPKQSFSVTGIVVKKNSSEYRIRLRTISDVKINKN